MRRLKQTLLALTICTLVISCSLTTSSTIMKAKNIDNTDMDVLSMGMTGDYQVAIEEGATMVRVGTGIFGARNYNVQ